MPAGHLGCILRGWLRHPNGATAKRVSEARVLGALYRSSRAGIVRSAWEGSGNSPLW
jgi:hypothetical protein